MKSLITVFCFTLLVCVNQTLFAQDSTEDFNTFASDFQMKSSETKQLISNIDSVPDFHLKEEKIKITGTIFQSDGITPAKHVTLYIYQPDEDGYYDVIKENDRRLIYHSATIKTDADGKYTIYTFIPGIVHRSGDVKHIHPIIKEEGKAEYELNPFYFDNDPLLTKFRRKRLAKKGRSKSILKVEEKEDMFVATRNIILGEDILDCK